MARLQVLLVACLIVVPAARPAGAGDVRGVASDGAIAAGLRPDMQRPAMRPGAAPLGPYTVDFEDQPLAGALFLNTPETLILPNAAGSGVTVTIVGHDDVRIYDLYLYAGNYGTGRQALIDMNWVTFDNPLGTDLEFDQPVSDFSLQAGDYGSDDDSPLEIVAYDVNDVVLGSDSQPWPDTQFPPFANLLIHASGIRRVHYSSGGSYRNSTFVDAFSFARPGVVGTVRTAWGRLKSLYR